MTGISETILKDYMIRKTKDQKTRFIDYMKSVFPELTVEEDKKNRNLVLGNADTAKVLLTAHYDTCVKMPFPNFITPMNFWTYLGYQLLVCIPFFVVLFGVSIAAYAMTQDNSVSYLLGYFSMMAMMFYLLKGGPANPWTANDNTSGVITLVELYQVMPQALKEQVVFVFFDNEESGLLGSGAFVKKRKKEALKQQLILNFDCVSDGDNFLFVLNKPAMKDYAEAFRNAYPGNEKKNVLVESTAKAFYPSDQSKFPVSAAVSALNKHKWLGLYMDKIHTPKDRIFDTDNILYLRDGTIRLLEELMQ